MTKRGCPCMWSHRLWSVVVEPIHGGGSSTPVWGLSSCSPPLPWSNKNIGYREYKIRLKDHQGQLLVETHMRFSVFDKRFSLIRPVSSNRPPRILWWENNNNDPRRKCLTASCSHAVVPGNCGEPIRHTHLGIHCAAQRPGTGRHGPSTFD